jgi:hypothetical protein
MAERCGNWGDGVRIMALHGGGELVRRARVRRESGDLFLDEDRRLLSWTGKKGAWLS